MFYHHDDAILINVASGVEVTKVTTQAVVRRADKCQEANGHHFEITFGILCLLLCSQNQFPKPY